MRAADALALCSGYEGLSHVLLEAMAAGLPVVVSDVGGNRALVHDGYDGLIVPYGDVAATARRSPSCWRTASVPRRSDRTPARAPPSGRSSRMVERDARRCSTRRSGVDPVADVGVGGPAR